MNVDRTKHLFLILLAALTIRLLSLGLYPLMDTTESRYGEMARMMVVTGDWITPYIEPGVPFWGKPPLHTWVSAASFAVFGVSEFAARLPHFLTGVLVLVLVWRLAAPRGSRDQAFAVVTILATSAVFMMSIGAVMSDTLLMFSVTLSLISAWRAISEQNQSLGFGVFIGLGLGMLAKGPVAVVLVGLALFCWCLIGKQWTGLFRHLPWWRGSLLSLMICAPWYLLAEWKTPGFLEYFFIGEHWLRFTVSGWEGDLYGEAHAHNRGTIWWYALLGGFPWSLVLLALMIRERLKGAAPESHQRHWRLFLWCWFLSPLILFSPTANILPAYVLPGIPALAFLVMEYRPPMRRWMLIAAGLTPLLFCTILFILSSGRVEPKADQALLQHHPYDFGVDPPIYWRKMPFSARYYSRGTATLVTTPTALAEQLGDVGTVVLPRDVDIPPSILAKYRCRLIGENEERFMFDCTRIVTSQPNQDGRP